MAEQTSDMAHNGKHGNNGHTPQAAVSRSPVVETTPIDVRRFVLVRHADVSGVSGVGIVAEGVRFTSGQIALQWRREPMALSVFASIGDLLRVHGHGGSTEVRWLDE